MSNAEDTVRAVVEPLLADEGLALDGLTIRQAGQRRIVQVVVDVDLSGLDDDTSSVSPLTLDEVADASRVIEEALDAGDVLGNGAYTLEVSSPGVSRPLTQPRHYRRNVGRLLVLTLADGSTVTGRLMRAGADGIDVHVAATKGKNKQPEHLRTLAHDELAGAVVQVEFNRPDAVIDLTDLPADDLPEPDAPDRATTDTETEEH